MMKRKEKKEMDQLMEYKKAKDKLCSLCTERNSWKCDNCQVYKLMCKAYFECGVQVIGES